MSTLLTVGFEFMEEFYYSLIRVKNKEGFNEYQITVMNGKLESILYGNHILKEEDGYLLLDDTSEDPQGKLKLTIAEALGKFLNLPVQKNDRIY
jgi:hypothetical protein